MTYCCQSKRSPSQTVVTRWLCCIMPSVTSLEKPLVRHDSDLQHVLTSLDDLSNTSSRDQFANLDIDFLCRVLHDPGIQSVVKVHEVLNKADDPLIPEADGNCLMQAVVNMSDELQHRTYNQEMKELYNILNKPHIRGLAVAHDDLVNRSYAETTVPDVPHEVDEDEESIKVVRIIKGQEEPLGATIRLNEESGAIEIARVMLGGAADRSGLVFVGDEVCSINGTRVSGKHPDQIINILADAVGPITLTLIPGDADCSLCQETKLCVRAHFAYNPTADQLSPCSEAGLSFEKGDILHIVSQDDPLWWQARRMNGDANARAGLIPAKQFQERKCLTNSSKVDTKPTTLSKNSKRSSSIPKPSNIGKVKTKDNKSKPSGKFSPKLNKKPKKTKKIMYQVQQNDEYDSEEVVIYEEVEMLYPRNNMLPRPIVLVGPPGVGKSSLQTRLIQSDPERYQMPLQHTSLSTPSSNTEMQQTIHVNRDELETDILAKSYVDVLEVDNELYCTSLSAVKSAINANKTCVLRALPQALKQLHIPDIKPFIVFVAPPTVERLKETRLKHYNDNHNIGHGDHTLFTDQELSVIIQRAERMKEVYSHYFDLTIVNDDLVKSCNELGAMYEKLRTEPQWVPVSWVR